MKFQVALLLVLICTAQATDWVKCAKSAIKLGQDVATLVQDAKSKDVKKIVADLQAILADINSLKTNCGIGQLEAALEEEDQPKLTSGWKAKLIEVLIKEIGKQLWDFTKKEFEELRKAPSYQETSPVAGSLWISSVDGTWGRWDGYVISSFYHPDKDHSATTVGKLGTKKSAAKAGEWAVSIQTRGLWGNKAYYDF